jgi:hypothetical protein
MSILVIFITGKQNGSYHRKLLHLYRRINAQSLIDIVTSIKVRVNPNTLEYVALALVNDM